MRDQSSLLHRKNILKFDKFFAFANIWIHWKISNLTWHHRMMHCCIESIFSFSNLFLEKNFQFEIQIGITFEWIGVLRCGFQKSRSHNNFYYMKCLVKLIYTPRSESRIIPISIVGFNHASHSFPIYFDWDNTLHTIQHLISERILEGLLPSCWRGKKRTD